MHLCKEYFNSRCDNPILLHIILILFISICDIVANLKKKIDEENLFEMVVRRNCVLRDAFRRMQRSSFEPAKTLTVRNYIAIS